VRGGREIPDIEVGYGAPRTLAAAETRAFTHALDALSDAELRSRFAPAEMMKLATGSAWRLPSHRIVGS
jgi:hypothetical protein